MKRWLNQGYTCGKLCCWRPLVHFLVSCNGSRRRLTAERPQTPRLAQGDVAAGAARMILPSTQLATNRSSLRFYPPYGLTACLIESPITRLSVTALANRGTPVNCILHTPWFPGHWKGWGDFTARTDSIKLASHSSRSRPLKPPSSPFSLPPSCYACRSCAGAATGAACPPLLDDTPAHLRATEAKSQPKIARF